MRRALIAFLSLAFATPVLAHGGHDHVVGTVAVLDQSHVEVTTPDGKSVSVRLTAATKYLKGKATAKAGDLAVGARVAIDAARKDETLEAREVRIGTGSTPKPPSPPQQK